MKDDRRHAVRFIVSQTVAHGHNTSPNETYKEIPDTTGVKTHRDQRFFSAYHHQVDRT